MNGKRIVFDTDKLFNNFSIFSLKFFNSKWNLIELNWKTDTSHHHHRSNNQKPLEINITKMLPVKHNDRYIYRAQAGPPY